MNLSSRCLVLPALVVTVAMVCTPLAAQTVCGGVAAIPCPEGQYCRQEDGVCGGSTGVCADVPTDCPAACDPVCACDGATYDNLCEAARAGVSVRSDGECNVGGPAVRGVVAGADRFAWEPVPQVTHYNVYAQEQLGESAPYFGECLYAAVPQAELIVKGDPDPSARWALQVTALYTDGEGSLGACHGRIARACTCTLPADPGPCDADIPRWFHNYVTGQCELFSWGGCGGNLNNFETAEECADACLDRCRQPAVMGDCEAAIPRWFFDKTSGHCESFVWGGCGGNANNFETRGDCVDACGDLCLLPPDIGPCDGTCTAWYYEPMTGRCEPFAYGCCEGNANNFPTEEACSMECPPSPSSTASEGGP